MVNSCLSFFLVLSVPAMSDIIMRKNLLILATAYARARKLSMSTVSAQIHGRQDFFDKYREGKVSTRVSHYWRMVDEFRTKWPPDLEWPETQPIGNLGTKVYDAA